MSEPANPVFCAIDTDDLGRAEALGRAVAGGAGGIKFGKEFFTAHGPAGVRRVQAACGLPLFLDLKWHDIPNTVAGAVRAAQPLAPFLLNVHASGGPAMLKAAREASRGETLVIAVTVLTSLDESDLDAVGLRGPAAARAVALARLAQNCGLDGVVCSAHEIAAIRAACGPAFRLVVPGVRPAGAETGDQKRVTTPRDARRAGADYLVVGRPITGAADPAAAARAIVESL